MRYQLRDGTWMKHSHTLQFGVVSVISCETGENLDLEILNIHCRVQNNYNWMLGCLSDHLQF